MVDNNCSLYFRIVFSCVIVLNYSGGTADIIGHEVEENGILKEIIPASGGNLGGTTVDNEFLVCTGKVHGMRAFENFKTKQALEVKKRTRHVQADTSKPVVLRVPKSLREMSKRNTNETDAAEDLNSMTLNDDTIRPHHNRFCKLRTLVAELLGKEGLNNITTLVFVGGYAESKLIKDFFRSAFSSKIVIVPKQPSLAVLKGATIFGHDPSVIAERVCRFTYGIAVCMLFDHKIHKKSTMVTDEDGSIRAKGCFRIHCKIGQNVKTGIFQNESSYIPRRADQLEISLPLYACPRANPVYVTEDDCFEIGELTIDISKLTGSVDEKEVLLALCFGGTEITMRATKKQTGEAPSLQDSASRESAHAPSSCQPVPVRITQRAEMHQRTNVEQRRRQLRKPATEQRNRTGKTLLIGDSVLRNVNPKGLKPGIQKHSKGGATITDLMEDIAVYDLSAFKEVIVYIGGNDASKKVSDNFFEDTFNQFLRHVKTANQHCSVYICKMAPRGDADVSKLNRCIDRIADSWSQCDVNIIQNTYGYFYGKNGLPTTRYFRDDGIHFGTAGLKRLLDAINTSVEIVRDFTTCVYVTQRNGRAGYPERIGGNRKQTGSSNNNMNGNSQPTNPIGNVQNTATESTGTVDLGSAVITGIQRGNVMNV